MGNAIFPRIETKIIDANNVDALDTLSEMTMARSKTYAILAESRSLKCLVGLNNSQKRVRRVERKLQTVSTYPYLFYWRHFGFRC